MNFPCASAIFLISVNIAVLRIVIIVRIPLSRNCKNPRFLGQVGTRLHLNSCAEAQALVCYFLLWTVVTFSFVFNLIKVKK